MGCTQIDGKQKAFMEQKSLLDKLIDGHQKEIMRLNDELLKGTTEGAGIGVGENKIDTIKELESALRELELKKGELRLKVIETYGNLPKWWTDSELK
jgi:hypothetical protein